MTPIRAAFYQSLAEMKQSYMDDLQMVGNYRRAVELNGETKIPEHIDLLQNQLYLLVDTIEQLIKHQ